MKIISVDSVVVSILLRRPIEFATNLIMAGEIVGLGLDVYEVDPLTAHYLCWDVASGRGDATHVWSLPQLPYDYGSKLVQFRSSGTISIVVRPP